MKENGSCFVVESFCPCIRVTNFCREHVAALALNSATEDFPLSFSSYYFGLDIRSLDGFGCFINNFHGWRLK